MKKTMEETHNFVVQESVRENYDTVTLSLACSDKSIPKYVPGQFITVYFPELGTPEGKAYSISSAPHEKRLTITVKAIGEFSHRLCAMQPGDYVLASLPYGFFYSENEDTDLIMIAAGIGIAPFRGTILSSRERTPGRKLSLFYSVRTETDRICAQELGSRVPLHQFITREPGSRIDATYRRMAAEDILSTATADTAEYLICGSISFVRDMWRNLRSAGISEDRLYTEALFSH